MSSPGSVSGAPGAKLWRRLEWWLIPAAAAATAVFVFAGMHRSIWLDEANSLNIARGGFFSILEKLRGENNFPFY
jgi:hypothetical protein